MGEHSFQCCDLDWVYGRSFQHGCRISSLYLWKWEENFYTTFITLVQANKISLRDATEFQEDISAHDFQSHYFAREWCSAVITDLNTTGELHSWEVVVPGSVPVWDESDFLREEVAETQGAHIQNRLHLHKLCWHLAQEAVLYNTTVRCYCSIS